MSVFDRFCRCGAQQGYPHHAACPEPMYYEPSIERGEIWDRKFEANLLLLEEPSQCEETPKTVEKQTKPDNKGQGVAFNVFNGTILP